MTAPARVRPLPAEPALPETVAARPPGVATAGSYLPELEALRGVAIALVVVFHTDAFLHFWHRPNATAPPSLFYALVRGGNTGVSLFFVLSAFLLTLPWCLPGRTVSVRRYTARRALRILPLYYAAVAAGVLVNATQLADLVHALPYVFFLNGLTPLGVPLSPFSEVWWSLATEVQFYVVLPVLMLLAGGRHTRWLAGALLIGWAIAYVTWMARLWSPATIVGYLRLNASLFGRAPFFLCGMAAAYAYARHGAAITARLAASPLARRGGADCALLTVGLALAALLRWALPLGRVAARPLLAWHAVEALLWTAVVLLVLVAPLRMRPLLRHRALIRLGVLSYSLYILHIPVIAPALARLRGTVPLGGWNRYSLAVAGGLWLVCIACSAITYRLIERPFLTRKDRVRA